MEKLDIYSFQIGLSMIDCSFYYSEIRPSWDAPHCRDKRITAEAISKIPESQKELIKLAKKTNETCERFERAKEKYYNIDGWRKSCCARAYCNAGPTWRCSGSASRVRKRRFTSTSAALSRTRRHNFNWSLVRR